MKHAFYRKTTGKWLALSLVVLVALSGTCAMAAGTDANIPKLGTGRTCISIQIVTSIYDYATAYDVYTDEDNLLDALLGVKLIEGEKVSWGFNVTTVDGIKADYENNGQYWQILEYVKDEGHLPLEYGIGSTPVKNGDIFTFAFEDPFAEDEDW